MAQVRVTVEGYGTFQINGDYINELISFLNSREAVSLRAKNSVNEVINNQFTGRQLIEENNNG